MPTIHLKEQEAMQEEEEKKAEEGPFSDPQSVEEASPINETIDRQLSQTYERSLPK